MRKSLYFMPFITFIEFHDTNAIEIEEIRFIRNNRQFDNLMPDILKKKNGVFVELVNSFSSEDYFNNNIFLKIINAIEIFKFSYYITNIPTGDNSRGFISESNFELFTIIEPSEDESIEHKIGITNGISHFLMSLKDYYQYKSIFGSRNYISISKNALFYMKYIYNDCIKDEDKLSIIRLYNKCIRITNFDDSFDKIIFARTSIEVLLNIEKSVTKKNYINIFISKVNSFIIKYKGSSSILIDFYEKNVINDDKLNKSQSNLEMYLENLRNARHNFIHENKINMDFMTIEVYITWFPLFFLITLFENKLTQVDLPRLIFFIKLLQLDLNKWNEKKPQDYNKMTCLETYAQYVRTITVNMNNSDFVDLDNYIKGFNKCFTD